MSFPISAMPTQAQVQAMGPDAACAFFAPPGRTFEAPAGPGGLILRILMTATPDVGTGCCHVAVINQSSPGVGPPPFTISVCPQVQSPPPSPSIPSPSPAPVLPLPVSPGPRPGPVPETPAKPPQQPCIKICPPDAPPPCEYKLVCSSDKVLYVIKATDKPRYSSDVIVASGDPAGWNLAQLVRQCKGGPAEETPASSSTSAQLPPVGNFPGCDGLFRFQSFLSPIDPNFWRQFFADREATQKPIVGSGSDLLDRGLTAFRGAVEEALGTVFDGFLNAAAGLPLINCSHTPQEAAIISGKMIIGLIQRYIGGDFANTTVPLEYAQNTLCPYRLPSSSQATTAYLANVINVDLLKCIVEANGDQWKTWTPLVDAARTKLSGGEYAVAARRKLLTGQQYADKMRETGVTRADDAELLFRLTEQIPAPSDLVMMMLKDAADDVNIKWDKEDALLPQKFKGILKTWAEQQGVSDEYMKLLWRAHFGIPAPGQLATMLHRLSRLPANNPAFVDLATVRNALIQQDISPKWVEQFVAISFAPLTRIDARRAFEIGALDEDELLEAYLNLGYDKQNALTLVEFNKKNVQRTFLRRSEVGLLAKGEMSDAEFDEAMRDWGASDAAIVAARNRAKILRSVEARKRCLGAYRKRFLQGDFDETKALALLTGQQLDLSTANVIVDGWKCERDARGKLFSAAQLAGLYTDGLIDETDYVRRAVRLGWEQADAVIMLRQLQRRQGIKAATAQQKELAQEERAQQKLARQLRQNARTADQQRRREATDIQKARSARDLRIKRVLAAGVKFAEHSDTSIEDAIVQIRAVYNSAMNNYPVTNDEVIAALTTIIADPNVTTLAAVTEALATALTTQAS